MPTYPDYGAAAKYGYPKRKPKPKPRSTPQPAVRPRPAPRPVDPFAPLSMKQIEAQTNERVNAALAAMGVPINTARQQAATRSAADVSALRDIGLASARIIGGIAPGIQAGYSQAAKETGDLAAGFSGPMADRVRSGIDESAQFAASQGAPAAAAPPVDTANLKDVSYGLGGFIPGGSLETQGAAARRWGEVLPGIEALHTMEGVQSRQAEANLEDREYEQQLIDLASKRPEMRSQVIDELYQREMDKLNAKLEQQKFSESKRQAKVEESQASRQLGVQERAQGLYEQQFGETQRHNVANERNDYASLLLRDQKQQASLDAAAKRGQQIDAAGSKVRGFVVDKQGRFVLDQRGNKIAVKSPAKAKDRSQVYGNAVKEAASLRGNPLENDDMLPGEGRYIARAGVKGVFPPVAGRPRTTNQARLAQFDGQMAFAQAQSYLMNRYGLTRARARAALIASGWKPDGKRPK